MDGEAARALGDLARERWFRATWERTIPDAVETDPWPDGVEPDLLDTPLGIARTEPKWGTRAEVRENERLYLAAIREARSLIYLENQYFTSPVIARALAERLAEPEGPEVILVSTGRSPSWFDGITMDTARAEVLFRLEAADAHDRFFAFAPRSTGGERIIVHAKVAIFDDRMLRIGSTNLNNRSMGLDTECDVAMLPPTDAGRTAIRAFRHRSISHFIGITPTAFARAETLAGSTGRAIVGFGGDRMVPLGSDQPSLIERAIAEWQLGDPKSSQDTWRPWKRRNPSQRIANPRKA
jgi:phosphatidylserine/phosphatidylglycerophosphate/cardiolipin synthase-like enzyme